MIRKFLEFLLSRSVDSSKPLAPWLRRCMMRDAQLDRFDSEVRQLDTLLRRTAAEHRQAMATEESTAVLTLPPQRHTSATTTHAQTSGHSLRWLTGLAAAAVLLLAVSPNWLRPTTPSVHAGDFSQQLTVVPGKVLQLLTRAAESSQNQVSQLSPLAKLTLPIFPAWKEVALRVESPMRQEFGIWQENWQNLKTRLPTATQKTAREL